jgi:hypothetical protein
MVYTLDDIGNAPGQAYDFLKRKYVSLTKPDKDGDYSSRKAAIARQEKLAEMLSQMGAQEQAVSTAGGITAPVSPMSALARGLTSFGGAYMSGKAAADEAALEKLSLEEALKARKELGNFPGTKGQFRVSDEDPGTTATPMEMDMPTIPGQEPSGEKVKYTLDMPNMPKTEIGGGARPYEDQIRLLDEYDLSSNPAMRQMAASARGRIEAERERNKPVYRPRTEYGGDLVNPNTQEVIQSFPSNEKPRVPGHITLGDKVYTKNPDGTVGAYLGPAPTGGGAKVDITIPQGPDATAVKEANQAASTNRNMEANYGLMIDMLDSNMKTGSTVPLEIGAKAALQSLGISAPTLELGTQQAFRALSNQAALYLRNPASGMGLTGNTSDRDITFLKQGGPGLAQSPFANEAVLLIAKAKARRNAELAELEMDHLTTQGNYKGWAKVKKDYVNSNSLFTPSEQARWSQFTPKKSGAGGAAAPGGGPPPAAIADLKRNPATSAQFDQVFGAGAAAKVLGK